MKRLLSAVPCLLACLWLGCGTGEYENRLDQRHHTVAAPAADAASAKAAPAGNGGSQTVPVQSVQPVPVTK